MSSAPGPPSPPDRERQRDRERVAGALLELCFEQGYRSLTLPTLLDRAEIGGVEFARHFDDLEDCFCKVFAELRDEVMVRVSAAVAAQPTWLDGLRAAIYAIVDFAEEDEMRTHLMADEARTAGDRAVQLMNESFERFFDYIDRGREARSRPGSISRATAEAIGGTILLQMYSAYRRGPIESVRDEVPKMMYAAVLPYLGRGVAEEELRRPPS